MRLAENPLIANGIPLVASAVHKIAKFRVQKRKKLNFNKYGWKTQIKSSRSLRNLQGGILLIKNIIYQKKVFKFSNMADPKTLKSPENQCPS